MPAIPAKSPLTIPPRNEQIYDSWWISSIRIQAPDNTTGYIRLELAPYNSTTLEISQNQKHFKTINVPLWTLIENVSSAATAMGAIFAAIPGIEEYYDANYPGIVV